MKLVIYAGYYSPPYSPKTIDEVGLGGTEQCIINLAKTLKQTYPKWDIWVVGGVVYGDYDGVMYRPTQDFKNEVKSVDTIIGVSYIHYIKEFKDIEYTDSIFWVHNTDYFTWWNGEELPNHQQLLLDPKLKHIICLTEWHKNKFIEQFPESKNKIRVIGNGVDTSRFLSLEKKSNQYIYTSHCERGLSKVLEDWPLILQNNPNAQLKISTPEYGLEYYNIYYKDLVNSLDNVEFLGTLPQQQLYQLMAESTYWYYPSLYEETFCITALEMLGHKVQPITWEWGGLKETLNGFNTFNENENINWEQVKDYLNLKDWNYLAKTKWSKVIKSKHMKLNQFSVITLNPENNQPLYDKCNSITLPEPHTYYLKQGFDFRKITQEDLSKFGVNKHPKWNINSDVQWYDRDVTDGEVGCTLSHIDTWVDAYASNKEYLMVFEDDFHEEEKVPWDQVNQLLERGYDLIYLGRWALLPEEETEIEGIPGWVEPDYSYEAHAYILSRRGIQILVEEYIDQFKNEIFVSDEFLPITYGKTFRQDILAEYAGKTRLKVAAPLVKDLKNNKGTTGYFIQKNTQGLTEYNKENYPNILNANNWETWCDDYINPHIRKGQYKLMVDEIGPNVLEFPLFTEKFCNEITQLAENHTWVTDRHKFYPTTDQTMESLKMQKIYQRVLEEFVYPIWIWFWDLAGDEWNTLNSENFIAKYDTKNQGSLDLHHDSSLITLNVRLNDDFKGGGTYLPKYKKTVQPRKLGNAMCHPGTITHLHGGRPVEEGTRYILVTFTSTNK